MKLFIQGTKYGYNILYPPLPTPTEFFQFAGDIRRIDPQGKNLEGKHFFSIGFARGGGCIFTKYVLIYDVQRGSIGNIGLSVHIQNNQKMASVDVKAMLDELANTYCQKYCANFYLDMVYEDWTLFTSIVANYESKLRILSSEDVELLQSGTQEAAFVYYSSDNELQKYFDDPYQEEYTPYRQIFFISNDLKGKPENPLNALRHSENDLTGNIDLDNPKYKLFKGQEFGKLDIKVSGVHNGNFVRKKDVFSITYFQQYRVTIHNKGTWEEIKRNDPRCIDIDNEKEVIIINPIELEKVKNETEVIVLEENSRKIDFKIVCRDDYKQITKEPINNKFVFKGDEIGYGWKIEVTADGYKKEMCTIFPERDPSIKFILKEQKIFTVEVIDRKSRVIFKPDEYELKVFDKKGKKPNQVEQNKIVFIGNNELVERDGNAKEWNIEIKKNGYKEYGEKVRIYPRNEAVLCVSKIYLDIEKERHPTLNDTYSGKQKNNNNTPAKTYNIKFEAGEHGRLEKNNKPNDPNTIYTWDYLPEPDNLRLISKDFKIKAIPVWGYKCIKFERIEDVENNIYIYKAIFEPFISKKSVLIIMLGIIAVLGISFLFKKCNPSSDNIQQVNKFHISQYVEGDQFFLPQLQNYRKSWDAQNPNNLKNDRGAFDILRQQGNKAQSITLREWHEVSQWINKAIKKRELIDTHNYLELKNMHDFDKQPEYKETINIMVDLREIDNDKYKEVIRQLGDVSTFTLTQIADSINKIIAKREQTEQQEIRPREEKSGGVSQTTTSDAQNPITTSNNQSTEQQQQEKFQENFWDLVKKKGEPQKSDFDNWFKSGQKISYQNEYKKFYDNYLNTNERFEKFKKIAEFDRIRASELSDLMKSINTIK